MKHKSSISSSNKTTEEKKKNNHGSTVQMSRRKILSGITMNKLASNENYIINTHRLKRTSKTELHAKKFVNNFFLFMEY